MLYIFSSAIWNTIIEIDFSTEIMRFMTFRFRGIIFSDIFIVLFVISLFKEIIYQKLPINNTNCHLSSFRKTFQRKHPVSSYQTDRDISLLYDLKSWQNSQKSSSSRNIHPIFGHMYLHIVSSCSIIGYYHPLYDLLILNIVSPPVI